MRKLVPLWVIPVLILFATGTVWLRLAIVRTSYAINQTDRAIQDTLQQSENLQLRVAALRSPRRLEGIARTRFKLCEPRAEQIIHVQ